MFDFTSPKLGVVASSGNVVVALMVSVAESVLLMPKSALQQCCSISWLENLCSLSIEK